MPEQVGHDDIITVDIHVIPGLTGNLKEKLVVSIEKNEGIEIRRQFGRHA